ncbi:hypothetical protein BDV97DRAFT_344370 [Delphinella strobiligena]|nr:hypothetical protein BDV97DRAFT_344370 [Delphinella strobiligena]
MMSRKIWVKRPGASPTMVSIKEDDMVDDVRDMVMRKYANSLGRSFDSPDVTLRIVSRPDGQRGPTERLLAPDEDMCRTLDSYYPGSQKADEALLIDVPARRTPRPSPRAYHHQAVPYHALDDFRPPESGTDYFPPMPAVIPPSAPHSNTSASADGRAVHSQALHADPNRSIAVLSTGQIPPLPSPGSVRRHRDHRPKYGRQHTSSPTILSHNGTTAPTNPNLIISHHLPIRTRPRLSSNASEKHPNGAPAAPPLPTPPVPSAPAVAATTSTPPIPAVKEQNTLRPARPRRSRKPTPTNSTPTVKSPPGVGKPAISSLLDNSVPPINVLIVEDNIINLKLLEAFMKRLKVRWSTAMNGQIAVDKWRAGGFHLVLMDIQLPIMSGLEATKEIRRLERVNGIGVFRNSAPGTPAAIKQRLDTVDGTSAEEQENGTKEEQLIRDAKNDKLNVENGLFKSPVIIVALTASSLQSDRHEALAAGCNDFLTKPVNFVWLERKVKEWGCMQALIDFDGWRKWKDFASSNAPKLLPASAADIAARAKERKAKRASRASLEAPRITNSDATASSTQNGSAIVTEEIPQEAT